MQKIDRFSTFPTTKISPNNTIFEMYYPDWKIRNILVLFPNNIPNNTNMNSYAILWIILKRHLSVITVITTLLTAYNTPWRTNRTEREEFFQNPYDWLWLILNELLDWSRDNCPLHCPLMTKMLIRNCNLIEIKHQLKVILNSIKYKVIKDNYLVAPMV